VEWGGSGSRLSRCRGLSDEGRADMTVNYWNVAGLVLDFFGVVGLAAIPETLGFPRNRAPDTDWKGPRRDVGLVGTRGARLRLATHRAVHVTDEGRED
jgi:hypothetical protein